MRRLLASLTTVCFLFVVSGCGGEGGGSSANATGPPPPPADLAKLFQKPVKGSTKKGKAAPKPAAEPAGEASAEPAGEAAPPAK